jgi:hypothetical protein
MVVRKEMLMSRHQNSGRNRNVKTANKPYDNMAQFKYVGTAVTNQNST